MATRHSSFLSQQRPFRHRGGIRRGFTLIELLVVIAVIAALAAILIPVVWKASRKASETRIAADLQAIGNALDAYKLDFGDYPRHRVFTTARPRRGADSGTNVLTWALLGPYANGNFVESNPAGPFDGADGPGFRVRYTNPAQGKVLGPFLSIDKFKVEPVSLVDFDDVTRTFQYLVDGYGNPILYFAARPGIPNISAPSPATNDTIKPNFISRPNESTTIVVRPNYVGSSDTSFYNLEDNRIVMTDLTSNPAKLQTTPADANYLGSSSPGQPLTAATLNLAKVRSQIQFRLEQAGDFSGPFILWSAGPDGYFFTADDVTNFNK